MILSFIICVLGFYSLNGICSWCIFFDFILFNAFHLGLGFQFPYFFHLGCTFIFDNRIIYILFIFFIMNVKFLSVWLLIISKDFLLKLQGNDFSKTRRIMKCYDSRLLKLIELGTGTRIIPWKSQTCIHSLFPVILPCLPRKTLIFSLWAVVHRCESVRKFDRKGRSESWWWCYISGTKTLANSRSTNKTVDVQAVVRHVH